MTRLLVIRKFTEASRATSFTDLWHSLSNDQVFDLCEILRHVTGREVEPPFTGVAPEDWTAMAALIAALGAATAKLNALLSGVDWDNDDRIDAVLDNAEREAHACGYSAEDRAVVRYLIDKVRLYLDFGDDAGTFGEFRLLEFRSVRPGHSE
jgi:hypothetical protein